MNRWFFPGIGRRSDALGSHFRRPNRLECFAKRLYLNKPVVVSSSSSVLTCFNRWAGLAGNICFFWLASVVVISSTLGFSKGVTYLRGSWECETDEMGWLSFLVSLRGRLGWKTRGEWKPEVDFGVSFISASCDRALVGSWTVGSDLGWFKTDNRTGGSPLMSSLLEVLGFWLVAGFWWTLDFFSGSWSRKEASTTLIKWRITLNERLRSVWRSFLVAGSETDEASTMDFFFFLHSLLMRGGDSTLVGFRLVRETADSSVCSRAWRELSTRRISAISSVIEGSDMTGQWWARKKKE